MRGSAVDGGLFMPDHIPTLERHGETDLHNHAAELLRPWTEADLDPEILHQTIVQAFNFEVPIVALEGSDYTGIRIVELFHGPTGSFKDFGARWLSAVLEHLLTVADEHRRVIVATSGDTGSAVADAFSGRDRLTVNLLFPENGISDFQKLQLTQQRAGVTSYGVDGSFDDCQRLAKYALATPGLDPPPTSANSINIGRLLPQMVYYAHAAGDIGRPLFVVPSGNLGNLTAGVLCGQVLGRDFRFVAAMNSNDSLGRFTRGEPLSDRTVKTLSNAMDVAMPSNLERLTELLEMDDFEGVVEPVTVSDEDTVLEMSRIYNATGYLADPHTCVAVRAAQRCERSGRTVFVLATADPAKFADVVERATGVSPEVSPKLRQSISGPTTYTRIAATEDDFLAHLEG